MANRAGDEDAEFGDADTARSGATLAIGDFGDEISLGGTSIATLEDLPSPQDAQTLRHQKETIACLTKENAELRRHVKRRTQALDTIRRAYIVDVDHLKRGLRDQQVEGKTAAEPEDLDEATLEGIPSLDFRPVLKLFAPTGDKLQMSPCEECGGTMEIVHYDEKELVKLARQIDTLREELVESGEKLGYSEAVAETYRLKAATSSSEFSELNSMLLREMKVLKDNLVDAGPQVVAKISEERDKVESRLRSANRTVAELENVAVELQGQLKQAEEDRIKVAEMEYHLLQASKEVKAMAIERDTHASAADELRASVGSLNDDLQEAADRNAKLQKAFQDHEENNRHSIEKLRRLLDNSKTTEAALRDELAELREENLHLSLAGSNDSGDSNVDEPLKQQTATSSSSGFLTAFCGEAEVVEAPREKNDKMLVLELTEGLRRKEEELEYLRVKLEKEKETRSRAIDKALMERELEAVKKQACAARTTVESTAAVGEDILSGAYAKREEQAAREIAELKALVQNAEAQTHKVERENRKLLMMWNTTRARLLEAEQANFSSEGGTFSLVTADPSKDTKGKEAEERGTRRRSRKRARRSTRKGGPLVEAGTGHGAEVLSLANNKPADGVAQGGGVSGVSDAQPAVAPTSVSDKNVETLVNNAEPSSPPPVPRAASENDDTDATVCSDGGDVDDVMAVAITYLEEDCRRLRVEKGELQGYCTHLKNQSQDLGECLERVQINFKKEKQGKEEAERELEERRELLSKATLAIAEHSMALHDAQEGTETVKAELELERQGTAKLELKTKEMVALHSGLERSLSATKNALELMTVANSEAEAMAERNASRAECNALQADRNALRAEGNSCWAEAEGMRAEEAISRHFLSDVAAAEKITTLRLELEKHGNELKRRRQEAKEHAEQMKEFRQVLAEKAKLEDEVNLQHQINLDLQQKTANDQVIIEELKLQVVLLDEMRKEILRLEGKVERLQKDLVVTKTSLEELKKQHEAVEQHLREKNKLSRKLWAALVGAIFLVDDWCTGPLLAWRETDTSATPTVLPKPPFEARAVEEIMKLRRAGPGAVDTHGSCSTMVSSSLCEDTGRTTVSIEDRLEGQQPYDIKAWLDFRVQVVAAMEHNDRVDSAHSEKLLLGSICKQRAAQTLNLEEALRKLEAKRATLQLEYDHILVVKEELSTTVSKQNESLLDNSKELRKYALLKVDHEVQVRQLEKATKCLHEAEGNIRRLDSQLGRAIGVAAVAENTAKEAECGRVAAVEERETAVNEVNAIRDTMERREEQAEIVKQKLDDLVQADATRLATNKTVATEVGYGDLTEEAGTMTTYLCPELTIRQLRWNQAERAHPESVGRVYPALKHAQPCEHPLGHLRPYVAFDRPRGYGGGGGRKGWKQDREAPPSSAICSRISTGERPVRGIGGRAPAAKPPLSEANLGSTSDTPPSPPTTEHPYQSWTNGAQEYQEEPIEQIFPYNARVSSHSSDGPNAWSFGREDDVSLPRIY